MEGIQTSLLQNSMAKAGKMTVPLIARARLNVWGFFLSYIPQKDFLKYHFRKSDINIQ